MRQETKLIDITRSFVPIDPSKYPNNYHDTQREDTPEDAPPVVAYEGYNFMPTGQGYKSYFGTNTKLGIDSLDSNVDKLLLFQTQQFDNILVALCADGIWTKKGDVSGAWTQEVILPESTEEKHYAWTYCLLENDLYMYRQESEMYWKLLSGVSAALIDAVSGPTGLVVTNNLGISTITGAIEVAVAYRTEKGWISAPSAWVSLTATLTVVQLQFDKPGPGTEFIVYIKQAGVVYKQTVYASSPTATITTWVSSIGTTIELPDDTWLSDPEVEYDAVFSVTPTFLNMEGQMGIFAAGIRLGFWDSENSIAWSSIDDYADFTPSIQTLAGSAIFADVTGRIVTIHGHGEGFVVYSTKSVIYVRKAVDATFQWDPRVVLNMGISYPNEVVSTVPNTIHFAYTHTGIYKIEEGREEVIVPDIYDYFKPMRTPVYLDLLEGRYLVFHIMDPLFLLSQVTFQVDTVPRTEIDFPQDYVISPISSPSLLEGNDACFAFQGLNQTMQNAGAGPVGASEYDWGPHWYSLYNAYYSFGGIEELTWEISSGLCTAHDVNDQPIPIKPVGGGPENVSQDETHKFLVADTPEEWYYRNNSEKFVATQLALWKLADQELVAFIAEILATSYSHEDLAYNQIFTEPVGFSDLGEHGYFSVAAQTCGSYDPPTVVTNRCSLNKQIILSWSEPSWGLSPCGLYLTRYATRIGTVYLKTVYRSFCSNEKIAGADGWQDIANGAGHSHADPLDVLNARLAEVGGGWPAYDPEIYYYEPINNIRGQWLWKRISGGPDLVAVPKLFSAIQKKAGWITEYTLEIRDIQEGVFAVDTAYMELAGWYNSQDYSQIVAAGVACKPPAMPMPDNPGSTGGGSIPISDLDGSICGIPFEPLTIPGLLDGPLQWPEQSVTIPASVFLLQKGSIAPFYPTFYGALVYDLHIKKWGKLKNEYKQLLDYQPINGKQGNLVTFPTFGIEAGMLSVSGDIYIFDAQPQESYIKYGKIGYYRQGFTHCEEIRVQFASIGDATVTMEASLDGRFPEVTLQRSTNLTNVMDGILLANTSARWYNIKVSGIYDLTYLEFRGTQGSRR